MTTMKFNSLIFSPHRKHRVLRHIVFWVFWFVLKVISSTIGMNHASGGFLNIVTMDVLVSLASVATQIPFCYLVLYFVIPRYVLPKKYLRGAAAFMASLVAYYWLDYAVSSFSVPLIHAHLNLPPAARPVGFKFIFLFHIMFFSGVLVCCSLMCSLKFLKFWYIKQQENIALTRENVVAELQLLKAQVHPHFLFNTLNNIYSFTLIESPLAGDLLRKLSGILRYMILEGQHARVPLSKEIEMIEDYVSLEKVRYGDRLDIDLDIQGDTNGQVIAPLLMVPFIENSFKHGSSKMLSNPKVALNIVIEPGELIFTLINNKPPTNTSAIHANGKGGIGLKNVKKRLQLLYPGKHSIAIESTDTTFSVKLNIQYGEADKAIHEMGLHEAPPKIAAYADQ